ncbi:MAG: histidine--tRNA ligase [Bdellovibrionales bacterium]
MLVKSLRGMNDVGEPEIHLQHHIEKIVREIYELTGFHEVRTPMLESTALFHRGVGDTTDIVEKEMYTFNDRNGDSISLRPEGTASIVRATLEHNWLNISPTLKIYYVGPMFRHERPQKGRYRQHTQFGMEVFGVEGPWADVEIMATQYWVFEKLGLLKDITLKLSSLGCKECRPQYREVLLKVLRPKASELCPDCQRRLEKNPLRVFDCKVETCKKIAQTLPTMLDHLCEPCTTHFSGVQSGLKQLKMNFEVDPKIVRGIDYYTRTSFEFVTSQIGAQGTVCGGGRYDQLVEQLGGPSTPGVGCGMGLERLTMLLESKIAEHQPRAQVFFAVPDPEAKATAYELCFQLRQAGLRAEIDLSDRSMKSQFKRADKMGVPFCAILGGNELAKKVVLLKNMKERTEEEVPLADLEKTLKTKLG